MIKSIYTILIGIVISCYYFAFGFTFLPPSINTKVILAIFGAILAVFHGLQRRQLKISPSFLGAIVFALLFSLICFIATDYNHTKDYAYATYFFSFGVWVCGAYAICALIQWRHNTINLRILTYYLTTVCLAQCVFALIIDAVPSFQALVDRYIDQGQIFLQEVNRLYGIGASLDNAGIRFSITLILIAAVLSKDTKVRNSQGQIAYLLAAFFGIIVIGNMISRTTLLGGTFGIVYLVLNSGLFNVVIRVQHLKFNLVLTGMLILAVMLTMFFYYTNASFHANIRFAFEGFFNWSEQGEWRTDSTDKLNREMWVWPTDTKSWIIGTGLFDGWVYGTDIGYCRFILYCGMVGFSVFALFFVYNALIFAARDSRYRSMFIFILILSFVVWLKVSTDLFLFYALLFAMDMFRSENSIELKEEM